MQNIILPSTPYASFPKWLFLVPCSNDAKVLYLAITCFGNTSGIRRPSIEKLSQLCGCGRRMVERRLKELESKGLIVRVHRRNKKDGKLPNEYLLREPENLDELDYLVGNTMTEDQKKREFKNIKLGRTPKKRRKKPFKKADLKFLKGKAGDEVLAKFVNPPA